MQFNNSRHFLACNAWIVHLLALITTLYVYQNIQRGLFADGVTDFGHAFHTFDSVLNSFLIPTLLALAGFTHHHVVNSSLVKPPIKLLVNAVLYTFVLWSLTQGIVEILFSGYTGGKETILTLIESISYFPKPHLAFFMGLILCALSTHWFLKQDQSKYMILPLAMAGAMYAWQTFNPPIFPFSLFSEIWVFYVLGVLYAKHQVQSSGLRCGLWIVAFLATQFLFHSSGEFDTYRPGFATFILSFFGVGCALELGQKMAQKTNQNPTPLLLLCFVILPSHVIFGYGLREILQNSFAVTDATLLLVACVTTAIWAPIFMTVLCQKLGLELIYYAPKPLRLETSTQFLTALFARRPMVKWLSITAATVLVLVYSGIMVASSWLIHQATLAEIPERPLRFDASLSEEGGRLARIMGCAGGCHGNQMQGIVFSREAFIGTWTSANLTHAVRAYSLRELDGIIRSGVHPNGTKILHGMPSAGFSALTDEQLSAILSYIYFQPAHPNKPPQSHIGMKTRWSMIEGSYATEYDRVQQAETVFANAPQSDGLALARLACTECHGVKFEGNASLGSPPLVVTQAYTFDAFRTLLNEGNSIDGRKLGLMATVAQSRFSHFTQEEKEALFGFLRTLPLK